MEIDELLASGSPPTQAQRAHLNRLIDTSNDEISRLNAAIDKLITEREMLQQNVASYKAILAPIRHLPREMLREIFVSCLPANKATDIAITDAPLLLGRVCRSWRELTMSTPQLWASIHVRFTENLEPITVQRRCDEAQIWIGRSGICPLTVKVGNNGCTSPIVVEFIQSLTRFSTRWRSIELEAAADWLIPLMSLSQSDVPRLEKFSHSQLQNRHRNTITMTGSTDCEKPWVSLAILGGERLCDLTLQNRMVANPEVLFISKIKFRRLTRLTLEVGGRSTLEFVADIFTRCPNLVACCIKITQQMMHGHPVTTGGHFAPITHPCLSTFDLTVGRGYSNNSVEDFFSNLHLPQLSSFKLNIGFPYPVSSWVSVVQSSSVSVENLAISFAAVQHESVLKYLHNSTSIKRLRITDPGSYEAIGIHDRHDMMSLLPINNFGDIACPNLEVLELHGIRTFTDSAFVEFVRQHAAFRNIGGNRQLKAVHAIFHRRADIRVLSQLEDLITAGLSLSISYQSDRMESWDHHWPAKAAELEWPN
ncbi:hypothetical protein C8J56DRAFT_27246 [Mycena floridula]|nr:hypothetical protein C8J56DRAFT_27246 [Mycena floridula]